MVGAAAMIGAAMQAPLAALVLVLELTHSGFELMAPMIAATVIATAVTCYVDGYSIYSARLPSRPARQAARSPAEPGYGGAIAPQPDDQDPVSHEKPPAATAGERRDGAAVQEPDP